MKQSENKAVGTVLLEYPDICSHDIHLLVAVVEVTSARSDHNVNWDLYLLFHYSQ